MKVLRTGTRLRRHQRSSTRWPRSTRSWPSSKTSETGPFSSSVLLNSARRRSSSSMKESTAYCTAHPDTDVTKHFAYMIEHHRSSARR